MEAPRGWDDVAARSPWGHVLQSSVWAAVRERQGWRAEYLRIGEPLPVVLRLWKDALAGPRIAYVPRGPIVAPADSAGLLRALTRPAGLARERRAASLKAGPQPERSLAGAPR